jgi:crotonobetainyl-CoA:carnitine CoA-transferase CaiB-like acyl-CoA transferase
MAGAATYRGVRVVELSTTISGPYCGMILADQGADVIKVERPGRGDDARAMPPHVSGRSAVFHAVNRNKRSVVLDLKSDAGRAAFLALTGRADVVIQNYRPGVVEQLGIGPADIRDRNPGAVYCSISAFGSGSSAAGLAGYDPLIQAFTGMMSMTGEPSGSPVRIAPSVIDLTTGMWAAMAVMAALARRASTGEGASLETTMVDCGMALLCHQIAGMAATGEVPGPLGSASPITAPYEAFRAGDGWVLIAAGNDSLFARLCTALGCPRLAEEQRFADSAVRVANREALHGELQRHLSGWSLRDCLELLREAGVPASPVHDLSEALGHPIVAERELLEPGSGPLPELRLPITEPAGSDHVGCRPAPSVGQHTEQVLAALGRARAWPGRCDEPAD